MEHASSSLEHETIFPSLLGALVSFSHGVGCPHGFVPFRPAHQHSLHDKLPKNKTFSQQLYRQSGKVAQMAAAPEAGTAAKTATEKALWMLEGSHGMARDPHGAVELLQRQVVEHKDAEAMWLLGLCCEYGMGTEKDTQRAEQLYQQAAQQGNKAAQLLVVKLNKEDRGCDYMKMSSEQQHCC